MTAEAFCTFAKSCVFVKTVLTGIYGHLSKCNCDEDQYFSPKLIEFGKGTIKINGTSKPPIFRILDQRNVCCKTATMRICRWWHNIPHIVRKHFHILLNVTLVKFENIHLWQVICVQLMPKRLKKDIL